MLYILNITMTGIPKWIYKQMVEQGTNNSIHERDGSIRENEPLSDLERTTCNDPRSLAVVSPGYMKKPKEYQVPYQP